MEVASISQEEKTKGVEKHRAAGNQKFKESRWEEAAQEYQAALNFGLDDPQVNAICYSNKAFCEIKLENYGLAIIEADKAIKACPSYPKSYYRKGSAYFALMKYDDALEAFRSLKTKLGLDDPEALDKINKIKKIKKEIEFLKCIEKEEKYESIDPESLAVPTGYDGPKLLPEQEVTEEWVKDLMGYQEKQKNLHKKFLWVLLNRVIELYEKTGQSLEDVTIPRYSL
jgi:serine/threonine-protein phosphatase 5